MKSFEPMFGAVAIVSQVLLSQGARAEVRDYWISADEILWDYAPSFPNDGSRIDVAEIFPASSQVMELTADNPGRWMFHCHVNDHINAGMMAQFEIRAK